MRTTQIAKVTPGTVVQFNERTYDSRQTNKFGPNAQTLPLTAILQEHHDEECFRGHHTFSLTAGEKSYMLYLPPTMEVGLVQGKARIDALTECASNFGKLAIDKLTPGSGGGIRVGSDPEIFLEENGKILPAFDVLPDKSQAIKVASRWDKQAAYWDGFQAEFTTCAASCLSWQVDSVQEGLKAIYTHVHKTRPNFKFSTQTTVQIPQELLAGAKEEHVQLGCMPSLNIYGAKGILPPNGREFPIRSAGGHIHIDAPHKETDAIVRMLDRGLGLPLVCLNQSFDHPQRRRSYGLAGEYRLPKYGVEYRTPSNAWMFHPVCQHITFDLARACVLFAKSPYWRIFSITDEEIQRIINECDVEAAKKYMSANKDLYIALMRYGRYTANVHTFNCFLNGQESFLKDPSDIINNWDLTTSWHIHSDGPLKNWGLAANTIARGAKIQ